MSINCTCTSCEHMLFEAEEAGYSSWTPGSPMTLECNMRHWDAADCNSTAEFRKALLLAITCPDFTQIDLEQLRQAVFGEIESEAE